MASERFEMRVPAALMVRVDAERGLESRASFFRRAAVEKLGGARVVPSRAEVLAQVDELAGSWPAPPAVPGVFEPARETAESGGCPDCGGQWTRRVDVPGRFCVDCGAKESR